MSTWRSAPQSSLVVAQILSALSVFALVALAPPAQGTMLLIPMTGLPQGQVTALALAHGATVVQRGPLASSLIVYGERDRLAWPLARMGVLTLSGGATGCGRNSGNGTAVS